MEAAQATREADHQAILERLRTVALLVVAARRPTQVAPAEARTRISKAAVVVQLEEAHRRVDLLVAAAPRAEAQVRLTLAPAARTRDRVAVQVQVVKEAARPTRAALTQQIPMAAHQAIPDQRRTVARAAGAGPQRLAAVVLLLMEEAAATPTPAEAPQLTLVLTRMAAPAAGAPIPAIPMVALLPIQEALAARPIRTLAVLEAAQPQLTVEALPPMAARLTREALAQVDQALVPRPIPTVALLRPAVVVAAAPAPMEVAAPVRIPAGDQLAQVAIRTLALDRRLAAIQTPTPEEVARARIPVQVEAGLAPQQEARVEPHLAAAAIQVVVPAQAQTAETPAPQPEAQATLAARPQVEMAARAPTPGALARPSPAAIQEAAPRLTRVAAPLAQAHRQIPMAAQAAALARMAEVNRPAAAEEAPTQAAPALQPEVAQLAPRPAVMARQIQEVLLTQDQVEAAAQRTREALPPMAAAAIQVLAPAQAQIAEVPVLQLVAQATLEAMAVVQRMEDRVRRPQQAPDPAAHPRQTIILTMAAAQEDRMVVARRQQDPTPIRARIPTRTAAQPATLEARPIPVIPMAAAVQTPARLAVPLMEVVAQLQILDQEALLQVEAELAAIPTRTLTAMEVRQIMEQQEEALPLALRRHQVAEAAARQTEMVKQLTEDPAVIQEAAMVRRHQAVIMQTPAQMVAHRDRLRLTTAAAPQPTPMAILEAQVKMAVVAARATRIRTLAARLPIRVAIMDRRPMEAQEATPTTMAVALVVELQVVQVRARAPKAPITITQAAAAEAAQQAMVARLDRRRMVRRPTVVAASLVDSADRTRRQEEVVAIPAPVLELVRPRTAAQARLTEIIIIKVAALATTTITILSREVAWPTAPSLGTSRAHRKRQCWRVV